MEIKASQSGSLISPEFHWLIYITKTCHWKSIHIFRPNQCDWRVDEASGNRELSVSLIDLFISSALIPRMVWPTLIYARFWISRIFYAGGEELGGGSHQGARSSCDLKCRPRNLTLWSGLFFVSFNVFSISISLMGRYLFFLLRLFADFTSKDDIT